MSRFSKILATTLVVGAVFIGCSLTFDALRFVDPNLKSERATVDIVVKRPEISKRFLINVEIAPWSVKPSFSNYSEELDCPIGLPQNNRYQTAITMVKGAKKWAVVNHQGQDTLFLTLGKKVSYRSSARVTVQCDVEVEEGSFEYSPPSNARWSLASHKEFLGQSNNSARRIEIDPMSARAKRFAAVCKRSTPSETLLALLSKITSEWRYGNPVWIENFYRDPKNKGKPIPGNQVPPMSEMMLEGSRGACSGWATGFVAVCRAAGIPSREMVGYLVKPGGPYNLDKYTTSQDPSEFIAHARAEVWLDGIGWVPVEPQKGEQGIGLTTSGMDGHFINFGFSNGGFSSHITAYHNFFLKATVREK